MEKIGTQICVPFFSSFVGALVHEKFIKNADGYDAQ